ncbi:hypothetical protein FNYG_13105 [Fusarium nygamai]|uniref:VOC domain-containing protein n=1 Tax=Gibberella nygamai TaxID=42673 RepID=A0A2K0VU62_GIBNY|nr:hypothetical protein FNYG_13105 [Fusarium nygamai]
MQLPGKNPQEALPHVLLQRSRSMTYPLHRINTGPFTVYYLGYPQTDEHRADLAKFAVDTLTNLPHTLGLLELFHVHGSEKQGPKFYATGNTPPNLGFGHLGFTVPNVQQALVRLIAHGVPVFKDVGPCEEPILISYWEKQRGVGVSVKGTESELHPNYAKLLEQIAFVQDPVSLNLPTSPQIDEEPGLLEPTS